MFTNTEPTKTEKQKLVGIQFRADGKIYDFDPGPFVLQKNTRVVVLTDDGPAVGIVAVEPQTRGDEDPKRPIKKIFRLATPEEIDKYERNCAHEKVVYEYCHETIKQMELPMCLVSVERRFDGSKIVVYFTADGRVDFRELVKNVVQHFKCRIEMRQIGVRQQAKMVGGIGPCGRTLCCSAFLSNFAPVTIKMAKGQNISLNPDKISGMCGRLMCCLNYEYDEYEQRKKSFPKVGKKVKTQEGEGKVVRQNVLKRTLTVMLDTGTEVEVELQSLVPDEPRKKKSKKKKSTSKRTSQKKPKNNTSEQ